MCLNNKMKIRFLIFSIAFFLSTSFVFGQSGGTSFIFFYNGNQYGSGFLHSELKTTPSWNLEKGDDIPLSIQSAIEIARENLKRFIVIKDNRWSVSNIYLRQIYKDKWVYSIQFYCSHQECVSDSKYFSIHLKMDGSIIEPTIKPFEWKMPSVDFGKGLDSSFNFGGNEYKFKVTADDLKDTLSWNPEKDNTEPLSFQKAVEIGREKFNSLVNPTANDKWSLDEISFRYIGKDKWLYKISFECVQEYKLCGFFSVYVKTDGSVVEPTITPKIEKQNQPKTISMDANGAGSAFR